MWHCYVHALLELASAEEIVGPTHRRPAEARSSTLSSEAITGCTALPLQFLNVPNRGICRCVPRQAEKTVRTLQLWRLARWDRVICGIQDQQTQRRLLAEPDLTLKRAFEVAQAIELAHTQVKELQYPPHGGSACHWVSIQIVSSSGTAEHSR